MSRVILLDPGGTAGAVRDGLGAHRGIEIVAADAIPSDGDDVVALLVAPEVPVGAAQLEPLPGVRIVAATATGFDHLDLEAISAAGAWASHCPGYCDEEVAEHAVSFAVDLLRGVTFLDRSVRSGHWNQLQFEPRRVAGAVLGVVGLGRIGREVARRGLALGMQTIASDPLIDPADAGPVKLVSLQSLLGTADVVTLHTPLTAGTRGMIDGPALAQMQPSAYLINCARAALVDHDALGDALRRGALAGCALDVLPHEPPRPDEPALDWPHTLLNPHAAWYSPESATAPYRMAGEAVAAVLDGRVPYGALARPG